MKPSLLLLALAGCAAAEAAPPAAEATTPAPPRPAACREVEPGALAAALADAAPGDALCLRPGVHPGPVEIGAGVTVWGPREAVIRTSGEGTTVQLRGEGVRLLGVTVDGSGGRFDVMDAAVKLKETRDAVVEGVKVENAVFGILSERSARATIRGNHVVGTGLAAMGLRGDSIRLWETHGSSIEENLVERGRDVVVWYSSDNVIRRNVVRLGRYGTHLMYSHRNRVLENRFLDGVVGVFVMYSRDVELRGNVMAGATGAAGLGLGVKESGNLQVVDNRFVANTVGAYLDTSPLQQEDHNLFERNVFRLGDAGVVFHSSQRRNAFRGNSFRDNHVPVRVEGGGDALEVEWDGNDYDEYQGYDLDGDGVGDVPYELRSLASDLVSRHPELEFFRGSATLALVNVASHVVPLLAPRTVLRDPRPRMGPLDEEEPRAD